MFVTGTPAWQDLGTALLAELQAAVPGAKADDLALVLLQRWQHPWLVLLLCAAVCEVLMR